MAYTAGDVLVRAVMQNVSGLPQDVVVNDFAFQCAAAPDSTDVTNITDAVDDFYRLDGSGFVAVGKYIGQGVNRSATHELQFFHIVAGPLGSPFASVPWLGPVAPSTVDVNLPSEVSGVLSFHGDLSVVPEESGSTRPRARRRGRVYIGPLTTDAITPTLDNPHLSDGFTQSLRSCALRMKDAAEANDVPWCVWSRANATLYPVVAGWTDDACDTQRRRGQAPNTRVVWGP